MSFYQSFRLALKSILSNKMRSLLTMLGIIIGVAAVIIIVSLGEGMQTTMNDTFASMGTNLLTVNLRGRGSTRTVTPDDMFQLVADNPDALSGVSPQVSVNMTVKYGTDSTSKSVDGVSEDYYKIRNLNIAQGRFIEYIDIVRRQKVCAIGSYTNNEMFGSGGIGQTLRLNGEVYTVVGILEEKAGSQKGSDDDSIYIPYTNAAKFAWSANITSYSFSSASEESSPMAKQVIKDKLYSVYQSEDAYSIMSMAETLSELNSLSGTMVTVLAAIAAISLLVGGIGIMNIMLVSVSERTREIGIRKSLGAKRRDILRQFVTEAAATSAVGGSLGILIGVSIANATAKYFELPVTSSVNAILLAFGVSVSIGILFGFLPARKAAGLNPIDALRYD